MSSPVPIALALASVLVAGAAEAQRRDAKTYPTSDRVEFVLECMQKNGGKQEYLYKCSCVIDDIATQLSYDDFVAAGTAARFQGLGGDRGGLFRDPPETRAAAQRYMKIQGDAMKRCDVPR